MSRVLLVGQAPSRTSDPSRPLEQSQSGRRLLRLSGLQPEQFKRTFEMMNLLDCWPGAAKTGDLFPMPEARLFAERMLPSLAGRRVILLGPAVAEAFRVRAPLLRWLPGGRLASAWAIFPHPSGVSRYWNDPERVREASYFLAGCAVDAPMEVCHPPLFFRA